MSFSADADQPYRQTSRRSRRECIVLGVMATDEKGAVHLSSASSSAVAPLRGQVDGASTLAIWKNQVLKDASLNLDHASTR